MESRRNSRYFGESISALIKFCTESGSGIIDTPIISESLGIKKRRLYDIVNVLDATGCLEKVDLLQVKWIGISAFPVRFKQYIQDFNVFDSSLSLSTIIPSEMNVSITNATKYFLIMYIAMHIQTLNIRKVAYFISRKYGNPMNVLNKLYQLTHILHSAGFLSRTENIGEFRLNSQYFFTDNKEALSLSYLLSRPTKPVPANYFDRRREEFETICANIQEVQDSLKLSTDNELI